MKVLGILKNKGKIGEIVQLPNKKMVGFKDYLVINIVRSICYLEDSESFFINVNDISSKNLENFLDTFDKIICFGNTYSVLKNYYIENSKKFIFVEAPLYKRDVFKNLIDHKYFRIMHQTNLGNNYIKKYSNNLIRGGFVFEKIKVLGENHILVINNDMIGDNGIENKNALYWLNETINKLTKITNKKIIIRDHPQIIKEHPDKLIRIKELIKNLEANTNNKIELSKNKYLENDLKGAAAAVMFASGACLECLLSGIPVISTNSRSYVYELCPNNINQLGSLSEISSTKLSGLFSAISNTHFTLSEIINADFWRILKVFIK